MISHFGSVLSAVEHWHEDGLYFIRSTEFDCYAEGEDFSEAVTRFGETFEDLAQYLTDLIGAGDASENEVEVFQLLAPRIDLRPGRLPWLDADE